MLSAIVVLASVLNAAPGSVQASHAGMPGTTFSDACHPGSVTSERSGGSLAHGDLTRGCASAAMANASATQGKPVDCHRDVRTHRIDGTRIRHRHVGDGCAVREVRSGNSF